jgi:glycolate oxidase
VQDVDGGKKINYKQLESKLVDLVGRQYVLSDDVDLALYECDGDTIDSVRPDLVVLPGSIEEVQAVVKLANEYKVPFTPRGAGTGLSGGCTTVVGGISLVLTRMNKVLEVDATNLCAMVEVGATNVSITKAASKHNLHFAPDPSSQIASTIGGNIAENAGGPHTLKYGLTTNHVLGLTVVMPDGEIMTLGGKARPSFGLDLIGILVGSEGTLGVVCQAIVRLTSDPKLIETMLAYFPSLELGGKAISEIIAHGVVPAAMEMMDNLTLNAVEDANNLGLNRQAGAFVIIELDGSSAGIEAQKQVVVDFVQKNQSISIEWAKDAAHRQKIWKARKAALGSLGRISPHGYVLDGVIPRSKLAEAIERINEICTRYELVVSNIYHAGDGNMHPCLLFNRSNEKQVEAVLKAGKEILEACVELGGTLSGEHGIGIEKLMEMPFLFSQDDLNYMLKLKDVFNPDNLCNPSKVVPTPKSCGESGIRPLARFQIAESQ